MKIMRTQRSNELNGIMKTVQGMKVETESLKKIETETKQEVKILECQTKTSEAGLTNRL